MKIVTLTELGIENLKYELDNSIKGTYNLEPFIAEACERIEISLKTGETNTIELSPFITKSGIPETIGFCENEYIVTEIDDDE